MLDSLFVAQNLPYVTAPVEPKPGGVISPNPVNFDETWWLIFA